MAGDRPSGNRASRPTAAGRQKPAARAEDTPTQSVVQTIRIAAIDVYPRCVDLLREEITQLRTGSARPTAIKRLKAIRGLHYFSILVFTDRRYDPTLLIEVNFDGRAGPFWAELESAIGPQLREMLRCCKRPSEGAGVIFDRVTGPDSQMPLAPLLEAIAKPPAAWHLGNRGMSRARIEAEAEVFRDARAAADSPGAFAGQSASQIHQALRGRLLPTHPCLRAEPPWRISLWANAWEWILAWAFGAVLILAPLELPAAMATFVLAHPPKFVLRILPGWVAPLAINTGALMLLAIALALLVLRRQWRKIEMVRRSRETTVDRPQGGAMNWPVAALLAFQFLTSVAVVGLFCWWSSGLPSSPDWKMLAWRVGVGVAGAVAFVLWSLARLRRIEEADPWQNAAPPPPRSEREIATLEDRSPQNHMASLVNVKPGGLRSVLTLIGLKGLSLVMRVDGRSRQGYLVNVRTIHFAHLTLLDNRSRLLFLSNFDGSWDNYLTDFTEKVQIPLTLVWNPGIGFPPTLFYVLEGVTHGRLFRLWKRRSMAPTLFWFCAYPDLSVEQIWRNSRLAEGLRRRRLSDKEAEKWARDL